MSEANGHLPDELGSRSRTARVRPASTPPRREPPSVQATSTLGQPGDLHLFPPDPAALAAGSATVPQTDAAGLERILALLPPPLPDPFRDEVVTVLDQAAQIQPGIPDRHLLARTALRR